MNRAIITYAVGAHEELLDISLPLYHAFAERHGYEMIVGRKMIDMPPAWNKVPLLIDALKTHDMAIWFDCDLIVTDPSEDFPPMRKDASHSLVRHFEDHSEVPNSGVWRVTKEALPLLEKMLELEVFYDHGWWEQAALLTLMGYTVPPQGSKFSDTVCRCVHETRWHRECDFMRLKWNSHPNYRAEEPRIVHCSYKNMLQRIEVMQSLVKDAKFAYPRYDQEGDEEKKDGDVSISK